MNKIGVCLLLSLILALQFAAALNHTQSSDDKIDKAYQCLETQINAKSVSALSLQEATFSILALGDNNKAEEKIESEKKLENNMLCWPKASCKIKDTAQAMLAYQILNKETGQIESYLTSKTGTTTGLNWFLLADITNHEASTCKVRYSGSEYTFNIGEDMKLTSSSLGSCLSIVPSGYWLQISSSCLDKSFEVSCDKNFLTTLLYQKSGSETIYVSPNTHTAASSGTTNETISSKCFKTGTTCDYEGTLWAALAFDEAGLNVAPYLPYLVALSSDNERFLPSAFLFKLTNGQDHYSSLVQAQFNNQYWQAPSSPYGKFYDTALALLGLQGNQVIESDNAKSYLLSVQGSSGCWNGDNIRDTGFILYAGWSEQVIGPGPGPGTSENCESSNNPAYSCVSSRLSCLDAGGDYLQNFDCPGSLFCCSIKIQQQTCKQLSGEVCTLNEICSGNEVQSADGSCCLGRCEPRVTEENECEQAGGLCTSSCADDEQESTEACTLSSDICCVPKEKKSNLTLIIILIILILLAVLAIVFRKRMTLMLHRAKRPSVTATPMTMRRPPFPPSTSQYRYPAQRQALPPRRQPSPGDKEMEETLHKLKEMSK